MILAAGRDQTLDPDLRPLYHVPPSGPSRECGLPAELHNLQLGCQLDHDDRVHIDYMGYA